MNRVVIHSRSGPDSKLRLEVPVAQPNAEFEVEVVVRPKTATRSFSPGYFDLIGSVHDETLSESLPAPKTQAEWAAWVASMAGAWQGEFERPPQGEYEERESLG